MSILNHFEFYTDEQVCTLQTYIEENFTLDATSKALVRNILDYIAVQGDDAENILFMLTNLLDAIGITELEIVNTLVPDKYKLTAQEKQVMTMHNGILDIDISKISGCTHSSSMDWCETHCPKYYNCHTIAMANDMLVDYELRTSEDT